ncbi:MAG: hypothetical protein JW809_17435 [Pirellulales bacterium]|nr:hypothetical protein [Pirellulales bacterium]
MRIRVSFGLALVVAAFSTGVPAFGGGAYWDWAWGGVWSRSGCVGESPPYFAVHPPVYYSRPIARPYGWSPFPWPPVAEFSAPRAGSPRLQASPVRPLRIRNPFVEQPAGGQEPAPNTQIRGSVQTVYPASMGESSR